MGTSHKQQGARGLQGGLVSVMGTEHTRVSRAVQTFQEHNRKTTSSSALLRSQPASVTHSISCPQGSHPSPPDSPPCVCPQTPSPPALPAPHGHGTCNVQSRIAELGCFRSTGAPNLPPATALSPIGPGKGPPDSSLSPDCPVATVLCHLPLAQTLCLASH